MKTFISASGAFGIFLISSMSFAADEAASATVAAPPTPPAVSATTTASTETPKNEGALLPAVI